MNIFNKKKTSEKNPSPKGEYHTYFTDVLKKKGEFDEGAVARKLREDKKNEIAIAQKIKEKRAFGSWLALIITLVIASFLVLLIAQRYTKTLPIKQAENASSFVRADNYDQMELLDINPINLNKQIRIEIKTPLRRQSLSVLNINHLGKKISTEELGKNLSFNATSLFYQSVDPDFTYGWYFEELESAEPFIVFRINSLDSVQKALLDWEPEMIKNLAPLFYFYLNDNSQEKAVFKNTLIQNRPIKEAFFTKIDPKTGLEYKTTLLVYAIIDGKYLLITKNPSILPIIIRRFTDLN